MLPSSRDELFQAYYIAGNVRDLAKKYGLPIWFVRYELACFGIINIKPAMVVSKYVPKWPLNELREGMRIHKTIQGLAKALNCNYSTIRLSLRIYGVFPVAWKRSNPVQWRAEELQKDVSECRFLSELTIKYKCNRLTIVRILNKFGIDIPPEKTKHPVRFVFTKEQLAEDYKELKTLSAIKKKYACSLYTIWKRFQEYEIPYIKRNSGIC